MATTVRKLEGNIFTIDPDPGEEPPRSRLEHRQGKILVFPGCSHQARESAHLLFEKATIIQDADPETALKDYRRALEIDPSLAGALVNIGTIFYNKGDLAAAKEYYKQALKIDPEYSLAIFNLAVCFDNEGRACDAEALYRRNEALAPNHSDTHYNLAILYGRCRDYPRAIRHYRLFLKYAPANDPERQIARKNLDNIKTKTLRLVPKSSVTAQRKEYLA
jgi:tetratricopeptide (TPR) repeat protein